MQQRTCWLSLAVVGVLTIAPAVALADAQCKLAAREEFLACKADCKDEYLSAKFVCRNIDPTCGLACRAGRAACMEVVDGILATGQLPGGGTLADCATGTDGCKAALEAAKTACGAPCAPGDDACDGCVDAAQVTAFVCRDTCRESFRANPVVAATKDGCRTSFKACIDVCPPAQ